MTLCDIRKHSLNISLLQVEYCSVQLFKPLLFGIFNNDLSQKMKHPRSFLLAEFPLKLFVIQASTDNISEDLAVLKYWIKVDKTRLAEGKRLILHFRGSGRNFSPNNQKVNSSEFV